MITRSVPICVEHHVPKEWRETTFEYTKEGITVRVPGVFAWVCPESGEALFLPETTDELISTVRDLLAAAKRARERRSMPTEYRILVQDSLLLESAA